MLVYITLEWHGLTEFGFRGLVFKSYFSSNSNDLIFANFTGRNHSKFGRDHIRCITLNFIVSADTYQANVYSRKEVQKLGP